MSVGLRWRVGASAVTVAISLACSPSVTSANNCGETCPVGCDISSDCTTCIPESAQAGVGTSCQSDSDCCTGSCQNNVCIASQLTFGSSGGSGAASTGSSSGGGTGSHGASGGSSGGSTGSVTTCTPANPPTIASDEQCGAEGVWVCASSGVCAPNCNYNPSYCGSNVVCEANGHCQSPTSSSSGGSTTKPTSSGGGSGSAGNGSGGASGGGSSSGGVASSSSTSGGSSSSSTSGGSSSGGSSSGGNSGCGGKGAEYASCTKNSDCACPDTCVNLGSGQGQFCLLPCTSYTDCALDEICDTTLSPASCNTNFCNPNTNLPWGACAGANDSAGNETGTCNMVTDSSGDIFGICEAGGNVAPYGSCDFTGSWSSVPGQECAAGEICVSFSSGGDVCVDACDPTYSLGAAGCPNSLSCESISGSDPYLGICQ